MTFAPRPVHLAGSILLATMLTACGGGGGGGGAGIIDPGDSDSVADALRVKFGGSDATVVEAIRPGRTPKLRAIRRWMCPMNRTVG